MRIGHKRDPFRSNMRVEVVYENESLIFESEVPTTISTILNELDIPSSTVLAVYNDTIVPHSSTISEDIRIELIIVSTIFGITILFIIVVKNLI